MRTLSVPVPHRVIMDVIEMDLKIRFVSKGMFPKATLPNVALSVFSAGIRFVLF